jgi:hypothetical protein
MKFNLKNRPDTGDALAKVVFDEWFEGFEAELRKKVVSPTNTKSVAVYDVIKEILGE